MLVAANNTFCKKPPHLDQLHERLFWIDATAADPLPIEEMFYNMSTNSLQPKWVGVWGTSKLEGSHPYYHASLPGSSYAPATASSILDCRLGQMNVQAAA